MTTRTAWLSVLLLAACGDDGAIAPDAPPMVDAGPGPADEIGFVAREALTSGSWLLANDWAADPNVAFVIPTADLAGARRELFGVNRVWSLGAKADGATIWFSAFDAGQEARFGLTIGDSIQNTFAYDAATQAVRAVASGGWENVNDECHAPSPDGASLYVCRRYDFQPMGGFSGWRLGRFTLATGAFEFLRPDAAGGPFELLPQALPDGQRVVFELRARPPMTGASIHVRDLGTGTEQVVRMAASRPLLAPDGHHLLFRDTASRTYKMLDLDQPAAPPIDVSPTLDPGAAAISPDGATIVYTVYDAANTCDHLERVTFAGTWSAPVRVRDCGITGEFITKLAWLTVP